MSYLEQRFNRKAGLAPELSFRKEKKPIPKKSAKRVEKEKQEREGKQEGDSELLKWYKRQIKWMDVCEETGLKLETHILRDAISSVCHILPKKKCPSVATHPLNRVFLIPDLHYKFDFNMTWKEKGKMSCWPVIQERLIAIYPDLAPEERKYFPESVLRCMESREPF